MDEFLHYIDDTVQEKLVNAYISLYNCKAIDEKELKLKLFEYPELRRQIDESITRANRDVNSGRYLQWSNRWFEEVVKLLPSPVVLDFYRPTKLEDISEKKTVKDYITTVEGYKQFRNRVDEIMLNFDFQKVHDVMSYLDWTWASWTDEEGNFHEEEVPSTYALRSRAYRMLIDAVERGFGGTGGFNVNCYVYDLCDENGVPYAPDEPDDFEHSVCLSLEFVVEEWGKKY